MHLLKKLTIIGLTSLCFFIFNLQASATDVAPLDKGAIVNCGALNVRRWAVPGCEIVGVLYRGNTVHITGYIGDWYQIDYNGQTAYVFGSYLQIRDDLPSRGAYERTSLGEQVVAVASKYLGTPYVYGGTSPNGFDCSGLVYYVYSNMGYKLSRTSQSQYSNGVWVSRENLRPGDLVFFYGGVSHVGIYAGNNQMIHAPRRGERVRFESIAYGTHYGNNYVGARRIIN